MQHQSTHSFYSESQCLGLEGGGDTWEQEHHAQDSLTEAPGYGCDIDGQKGISRESVGKTFVFPIQAAPTLDHPSFLPGVKMWHLEYLLLP